MAYEHKEGQGSLFKNDKQNDRQPDYKGTILINGVTYDVAAWERTSQKGMQYLSLQAELRQELNDEPRIHFATVKTPALMSQPYPDFIPAGDPLKDLPF